MFSLRSVHNFKRVKLHETFKQVTLVGIHFAATAASAQNDFRWFLYLSVALFISSKVRLIRLAIPLSFRVQTHVALCKNPRWLRNVLSSFLSYSPSPFVRNNFNFPSVRLFAAPMFLWKFQKAVDFAQLNSDLSNVTVNRYRWQRSACLLLKEDKMCHSHLKKEYQERPWF